MKGKIYAIEAEDAVYVGSTIQPLKKRYHHHREHFQAWIKGKYHWQTSYICFMMDCKPEIILLEEVEFDTKKKLLSREREWILKYSTVNTINFPVPNPNSNRSQLH
jgi:Uri superfamily endonuclease